MPRTSRPSATPADKTAAEPSARQTMLETAERLFAEEGLEAVPLHRIVQESGQRNRSALHYHFGSRPEVVSHVIAMRLPEVNALRHRYLDEAEAKGLANDLREVLLASTSALADIVRDQPWGARYARILAQANYNPELCRYDLIPRDYTSSLRRAHVMIGKLLPEVPGAIVDERLIWVEDSVVMTLGRLARLGREAVSKAVIHSLVDFCVGGLQADFSREAKGPRKTHSLASTRQGLSA
ncbi:MAG TPA: TetR family transcriptional regulator [Variovorax sp.]|nr:TetR family transcriptional regulator [Variovorax sp.]